MAASHSWGVSSKTLWTVLQLFISAFTETEIPNSLHHFCPSYSFSTFAIVTTKVLPWIHFYTSVKPGVPLCLWYIESGRFALAGLCWPHHDRRHFPFPATIGGYLCSLFSLWDVPMLNSPLLTNRCHSGMDCRELSPKIVKTAAVDVGGLDCEQVPTTGGIFVHVWVCGVYACGLSFSISLWVCMSAECSGKDFFLMI